MNKPAIEVKSLSKVYNIGHEMKSSAGTVTLRDTITNLGRKPLEFFTGHQMKKEKFWALRDINFNIEQGDVVGIIGRNGSGKSTMLKVLSRIVEPTLGEITMRGKSASLLEVGTGFHPELTGRENIYFNGSILGMKKKEIEAKFDEIVAFSEVEKFLDTPVKFYSSGMYVRLAFAVAAHLEPDILIVDEVLAVGDAAFQKKCLGKMQDVAGQGRTVLFVSHNMAMVKGLCTKGLLMKSGRVEYMGNIDKALQSYQQGNDTLLARNLSKAKTHFISLTTNQHTDSNGSKKIIEIEAIIHIADTEKNVDLVVGFGLEDSIHNRLATFVTQWDKVSVRTDKRKIKVVCKLNEPPLISGNYLVSSSISRNDNTLDYVDGGVSFAFDSSHDNNLQQTINHGSINIDHTIGVENVR